MSSGTEPVLPARAREAAVRLRAELDALAGEGEHARATAAFATLDELERTLGFLARVSHDAFDQWERRVRDLSLLHRAGELFASCFDLDRLCVALLDLMAQAFPTRWSAVYLTGTDGIASEPRAERGAGSPATRVLAREAASLATRQRRELVARDTREHPRLRAFADPDACTALLVLPFLGAEDCPGAFVLVDVGPEAFDVEVQRGLRPVADLASLAIRHARLCRRLVERQEDLRSRVRSQGEALDDARLALNRLEKMAALGKLAASVAHEINNPMSYVLSNVRAARECLGEFETQLRERERETPDGKLEELREMLADVSEGLERIRLVAHDLKGFERSEADATRVADLNPIVDTAVRIAQAEAKDSVRFETRYGKVPPVRCHRYQVIQVVLNLLLNAIEAVGEGGSVRISTFGGPGWARVAVTDDGPGIPEELRERVFEPFFTTKVGGSSGLGLAISRDIARAHGGSLEVESSPEGTTLLFTLPSDGAD